MTLGLPFRAKDLVEVIRNYDFKFQEFPHNCLSDGHIPKLDGLIDDDKKIIYIDQGIFTDATRYTIIHESLHAHSFINGLNWSENFVEKEANKLFNTWYGYKCKGGIIK